jgi:hypothetical protein
MSRKTHRSKSHKRRHSLKRSRKHTRKNGGACPCAMRFRGGRLLEMGLAPAKMAGGRGGLGGADVGHSYQSPAAYTTGASQTLYQLTGKTPGLSSGGYYNNNNNNNKNNNKNNNNNNNNNNNKMNKNNNNNNNNKMNKNNNND